MDHRRIRQRVEGGDRTADAVHAVVQKHAHGAWHPVHDLIDGAAAANSSAQRKHPPGCLSSAASSSPSLLQRKDGEDPDGLRPLQEPLTKIALPTLKMHQE